MKKKLWLCLIALLLNCSLNLFANDIVAEIDTVSLPVEAYDSAIAIVEVPIDDVRLANVKLNERKHLLEIVEQQELNLNSYKSSIALQDSIVKELQSRITLVNNINKGLNIDYNKQKKETKKWKFGAVGAAIVALVAILVK